MLNFQTYDIQTICKKVRLPFKHDYPVYNKVQIESFGIVSYRHDFIDQGRCSHRYVNRFPSGSFQKVCLLLPHRSQFILTSSISSHLTQNVCTHTSLCTFSFVVSEYILNLRGHKIMEYIQYIVSVSGQNFLQWSHETEMS
jgi:hypothetical protein